MGHWLGAATMQRMVVQFDDDLHVLGRAQLQPPRLSWMRVWEVLSKSDVLFGNPTREGHSMLGGI